jgi:tetratricopeptide (TPR) repeat protein
MRNKYAMSKSILSSVLMIMVLSIVLVAGCNKQQDLTMTEQVLEKYRNMPAEEQEPALREFAANDTDNARYAVFELGNLFYDRAQERIEPPGEGSLSGNNALLDSALYYYQAAADMDSTFGEPLVNMGLIWDNLSDGRSAAARAAMAKARDLYQRAIEINPLDEKARCNLGSLYFRKQQRNEAMQQFRATLDANPESALAHFHLASMFAESRIYKEAVTEWELAAKYDKVGDIRERSRENIRIIDELLNSEIPENVKNK